MLVTKQSDTAKRDANVPLHLSKNSLLRILSSSLLTDFQSEPRVSLSFESFIEAWSKDVKRFQPSDISLLQNSVPSRRDEGRTSGKTERSRALNSVINFFQQSTHLFLVRALNITLKLNFCATELIIRYFVTVHSTSLPSQ